ncbi:hypothetical protein [Gracilimonas halophila]|uniref:Tfp pilus assembly protein PilO n=1 Tax=Gracilimonas halophila TaxID=1834464 RepID=A0ABW5JIJ3_9BACT
MSYAVRNTIILLVALLIIAGGAYGYITFFQLPELERLESTYTEKQEDFNEKKATSDAFPQLNETYQTALSIIENYDKSLYPAPQADDVFDYLNYISNSSPSSKVYFDFAFTDSTTQDQYGIIRSDINGYGRYRNVVNFINKIENSQLLNKVTSLEFTPAGGDGEELDEINFYFVLESYFERISIQQVSGDVNQIAMNEEVSVYNPFFPLIQPSIPPNVDNLINVEESRLIGLTDSRVFIVDQAGNITSLRKGDQVYLGVLESIDLRNKSATFNLNKGGITELVTLETEQ